MSSSSRPPSSFSKQRGKLKHVPIPSSSEPDEPESDGWVAVVRQTSRASSKRQTPRFNASQRSAAMGNRPSRPANESTRRIQRQLFKQLMSQKPPEAKQALRELLLQFIQDHASEINSRSEEVTGPSMLLASARRIVAAEDIYADIEALQMTRKQFTRLIQSESHYDTVQKNMALVVNKGVQISRCICWGLGSIADDVTGRQDSLMQLMMFEHLANMCTSSLPYLA